MTSTVEAPAFTDDDRVLLLALDIAEALMEQQKCPGCGQPIDQAWHADLEGWWEVDQVVCHACTAVAKARAEVTGAKEPDQPVFFSAPRLTYLRPLEDLASFEIGKTTESV